MKTERLNTEFIKTREKLKEAIKKAGMPKAVEISGGKQTDISAWLHDKRNWSFEKIIKIAKNFGL